VVLVVTLVDLVQKMVKQVDLVVEAVVEPYAEDLAEQVMQEVLLLQKVIMVELITEDLLPMEVVEVVEQPLLEEMQVHQKVVMEVQGHLIQLQEQILVTLEVVEVVLTIQTLVDLEELAEVVLVVMDQELQLEQPILVVEVDLVVILVVLDSQVVQVL
jgi:hypothetical protein